MKERECTRSTGTPADVKTAMQAIREWALSHAFVRRAWIFGSRSRGDHRADSDIDVAIEIDPVGNDGNSWTTWVCDSDRWEAELQAACQLKIDLNYDDADDCDSHVRSAVVFEGKLLYDRDAARRLAQSAG